MILHGLLSPAKSSRCASAWRGGEDTSSAELNAERHERQRTNSAAGTYTMDKSGKQMWSTNGTEVEDGDAS